MRRFQTLTPIIAVAALLAACESTGTGSQYKATPVKIVTDTFCLTAEKHPWDIADDADKIKSARRHNAKVDVCRKKRS